MTPERIFDYFPGLDDKQRKQFLQLQPVYAGWNEKLNLVSRSDIMHLHERHILHSLAIARFIRFTAGTRVMDLGTGGGFPGIPLAIMFPDAQFTLVDSIAKKINAVQEISRNLGLTHVNAVCSRAEAITESFDYIVSRATAPLSDLFKWSRGKILTVQRNAVPNGILCLKGGDLDAELRPFAGRIEKVPLHSYFEEEFFETKQLIFLPI
jgi:16S rRNA (guanine527-N7)-methyltransferase